LQKIKKRTVQESVKFVTVNQWTADRPYLKGFQNSNGEVRYQVDQEVDRSGNQFDQSVAKTALTIVNFTKCLDLDPYKDLTRRSFARIIGTNSPLTSISIQDKRTLLNHFGQKAEEVRKSKYLQYQQEFRAQVALNRQGKERAEHFQQKVRQYSFPIRTPLLSPETCVINIID